MGWARSGRGQLYRRSVRRGRRVLSEYYGGEEGRLAAALDEARRRRRREEADAVRRDALAWLGASSPLAELEEATDLLAEAALHAAGFYKHNHGAWRRRGRPPGS